LGWIGCVDAGKEIPGLSQVEQEMFLPLRGGHESEQDMVMVRKHHQFGWRDREQNCVEDEHGSTCRAHQSPNRRNP
jgi:hypothetical protein